MKTFQLIFRGGKEDLHQQFKILCAKQGVSMTDKLIDFINKTIILEVGGKSSNSEEAKRE